MKANYSNWVPNKLVYASITGTVLTLILFLLFGQPGFLLPSPSPIRTFLSIIFGIFLLLGLAFSILTISWHFAFSYHGKRQMSKQIIDGISEYLDIPDGGRGLDVGCGSGALTIAFAKRNPNSFIIGIDRWGKEYSNFSKDLCDNNAIAENVTNVFFKRGDAANLEFQDETFDLLTSNYVYHNIPSHNRQDLIMESLRVLKKGGKFVIHDIMSKSKYGDIEDFRNKLLSMGYENVELIDTTKGKFMNPMEARFLGLWGSKLLIGIK